MNILFVSMFLSYIFFVCSSQMLQTKVLSSRILSLFLSVFLFECSIYISVSVSLFFACLRVCDNVSSSLLLLLRDSAPSLLCSLCFKIRCYLARVIQRKNEQDEYLLSFDCSKNIACWCCLW